MTAYQNTSVPVDRSEAAIKQLLVNRGITDTRFTSTAALFAIEFNWPRREMVYEGWGKNRKRVWGNKVTGILGVRIVAAWPIEPQEQRRIVRVLYWHLKSKLEFVESGLVEFEQEFMPHLAMPTGGTMYDEFRPRLAAAIERGDDLKVQMGPIAEATLRALPESTR